MATKTFNVGPDLRYGASERVRLHSVNGVIWILRVRADGGWMHSGRRFMPLSATRKQIVEEAFGQIYRAEEVAA
jgi:hypothetical protein